MSRSPSPTSPRSPKTADQSPPTTPTRAIVRPTPGEARRVLERYREPRGAERFVREVLGHDPWDVPCRIMRDLARPRASVAVKSCHGSGKTYTAAEMVLWWTFAMGGIALTTAPTWVQVEKLLWGYIHAFHARSRYPLGGKLTQTELRLGPDTYALGLSTNEGVRFQGFHGTILIVLDEAPGVRPDIWESIRGIRSGGDVRLLALGNPVVPSGPFFDIFYKQLPTWTRYTIDALQTPNFGPDADSEEKLRALDEDGLDVAPRPYLAQRRWAREILEEVGADSPVWACRVRGAFPDQAEDSVISLAWLERGRVSDLQPGDDDEWVAGVDCAGPGEAETVMVVRHGPRVVAITAWKDADPRGVVVAALHAYRARGIALKANVDGIGIGQQVVNAVKDAGYTVRDINVGLPARDRERYANAKAEYYWGLRLRLQAGDCVGLDDDLTIAQLCAIRYGTNARGQIVIESKDEARKRGVKSPDRAEAVMLCCAAPREAGVRAAAPRRATPAHDDDMDVFTTLRGGSL